MGVASPALIWSTVCYSWASLTWVLCCSDFRSLWPHHVQKTPFYLTPPILQALHYLISSMMLPEPWSGLHGSSVYGQTLVIYSPTSRPIIFLPLGLLRHMEDTGGVVTVIIPATYKRPYSLSPDLRRFVR